MPKQKSISKLENELRKMVLRKTRAAAKHEWLTAQSNVAEPLYDYRGDHVTLVVRIAKFLAKQIGADEKIVMIAAWLHDIAKLGISKENDHGEKGALIAVQILKEKNIDDEMITKVADAIRNHVGLYREKPLELVEAQIIWEADKLAKLGLVGLLHFVLNGIRIRPGMTLDILAQRIKEFIPLAEKIAESMKTPPAKALAQERLAFLKEMCKVFDKELLHE